MIRRINALLIGLLVCATLFTPAQAAPGTPYPGDLDRTFAGFGDKGVVAETGVSGAVLAQLGNQNGMARQPDGKIVTVGSKQANLVLFRYLPNGQRDATFSGDGTVEIPAPTGLHRRPNDVAIQPDGKIVVAGETGSGDNSDFMLVRLTASGELDSGFGNGGFVTTNFTGNADAAYAVLVQPDSKIAVCGEARISGDEDFAVARYLPNGALDTSFSGDGKATIGFGEYDTCYNMALQNDGKLMLVGQTREIFFDYDVASARLNRNGTLDGSYSGDGKLISNYGYREEGGDVVIQPDGKIVLLGGSVHSSTGYIARYLTNGDRDTATFGNGTGIVSTPTAFLFDLELLPDGRLVALGCHICDIYSDGTDFAFYRLLANGNLDPTFNEIGMLWPDFGGAREFGTDLALLPDGRILGFGTSDGSRLILAQLWPDGTLDTGGRQTHSVSPGWRETAFALAAQPDGKLLVAGEAHYWLPGFENSNVFLSRFHANGQVDTSPAPTVTHSFLVGDQTRQEQTITIEPDPLPAKLERDQPFTLAAKASSGLPVEIVSATPEICAVVDTTVVGQAEGRCTISVSQAGDAEWKRVRVKLRFKIVAGGSS